MSDAMAKLTVEEYLDGENYSRFRSEYADGLVFAMTGASEAHNVICTNLGLRFGLHLQDSDCRYFSNEMKVYVQSRNSFYYPDLFVTCEPFQAKSVFKNSPILIVEVLSPSTHQIDRREKFFAYRELPSLQEYFLVYQNRVVIEAHRRVQEDQWTYEILRRSDPVVFQSMPGKPLTLSMEEIYKGMDKSFFVKDAETTYSFDDLSFPYDDEDC